MFQTYQVCWFVTFIDDCIRVTLVYKLKQKSKTNCVSHFFSMIKNKLGASIKRIRSDNAKDYFNNSLNFLSKRMYYS